MRVDEGLAVAKPDLGHGSGPAALGANLATPVEAFGDGEVVFDVRSERPGGADRMARLMFVVGLGVSERASVQTLVVSGFFALFVAVQIIFCTLAKSGTCARFIGICTLARSRTLNLARGIVLTTIGRGQIAAEGILEGAEVS